MFSLRFRACNPREMASRHAFDIRFFPLTTVLRTNMPLVFLRLLPLRAGDLRLRRSFSRSASTKC